MSLILTGRRDETPGARPGRGGPAAGAVAEAGLRVLVERGGTEEFPVAGRSMHPTFEGIERVRVRLGRRGLRFGDLALFLRDGRLVVHRVVGRARAGYRTRGDGQRGFDRAALREGDLLGVVTHLRGPGREVKLEGSGAAALRRATGAAALVAGGLKLGPGGPRPGATALGWLRDTVLARPYGAFLRGVLRAHAGTTHPVARLARLPSRRDGRALLAALRVVEDGAAPRPRTGAARVSPAGWRRLARLADELGVAPLLFARMGQTGRPGLLPDEVRGTLERAYHAQLVYNDEMLRLLDEILVALREEGVAAVVLKGAALARSAYPGPALRTLGDIDLLLRAQDLATADAVLRCGGYRPVASPGVDYAVHHHAPPYVPPGGHPRLELHTRLTRSGSIRPDLEGMRSRSVAVSAGGSGARELAPEDQMTHACLHLAADGVAGRVKDLCDIDLLARRPEGFDWSAFARRAAEQGLGRVAHYALDLARAGLLTPVPGTVRAELWRFRLPPIEDRLLSLLARAFLVRPRDASRTTGLASARAANRLLLLEADPRKRRAGLRALVRRRRPQRTST
jgi:hypothetical protein